MLKGQLRASVLTLDGKADRQTDSGTALFRKPTREPSYRPQESAPSPNPNHSRSHSSPHTGLLSFMKWIGPSLTIPPKTWSRISLVSRHGRWGILGLLHCCHRHQSSAVYSLSVLPVVWQSLLCAHRNLFLLPGHTARRSSLASLAVRYDWIPVIGS